MSRDEFIIQLIYTLNLLRGNKLTREAVQAMYEVYKGATDDQFLHLVDNVRVKYASELEALFDRGKIGSATWHHKQP